MGVGDGWCGTGVGLWRGLVICSGYNLSGLGVGLGVEWTTAGFGTGVGAGVTFGASSSIGLWGTNGAGYAYNIIHIKYSGNKAEIFSHVVDNGHSSIT